MRLLILPLLAGCATALDDNTPYVSDPRVLAVKAEPPEVEAGDPTALTALYADASGQLSEAPLSWGFCGVPKPIAELGPVAPACLDPEAEGLIPLGDGITVTGPVPADACSLFGPNPPPPAEGEPGGRPADPDVTGGFYQPVLGFLDDGTATFASVRVRCGIANVGQEDYVAWNRAYLSNVNPRVASLEMPAAIAPGEAIDLQATWPDCPAWAIGEDPIGCEGAETYVVHDPASGELLTRREGISATWFATGGTLDEARSGRAGDEPEGFAPNRWTAPDEPGDVWLAVALRDERGGTDFAGFRITVRP